MLCANFLPGTSTLQTVTTCSPSHKLTKSESTSQKTKIFVPIKRTQLITVCSTWMCLQSKPAPPPYSFPFFCTLDSFNMVTVASSKISTKSNNNKIPVSKHHDNVKSTSTVKVPVSPTHSIEEEVIALRTKNQILMDAFKALKNATQDHAKRRHELVWYAQNRCRYPNHEASKFLDHSEEHREEIEKLRGEDGSFHHGFNSGVLAAARMFEAHADILAHVHDDCLDCRHDEMHTKVKEHSHHIQQTQRSFPDMNVEEEPTL